MTSVLAPPRSSSRPPRRLFTVADVARLPESLPSGDVRYELDNGELVTMPPPGDDHSALNAKLGGELYLQGERQGHGKARVEVGIVLWRNPDRLVGADAAFIAAASLPIRKTSEGYLETVPDLIVEIRSRNDTMAELQAKSDDYLAAGAKTVWLVDPPARRVVVRRAGQPETVFGEDGCLDAGDIIPGFRLAVAELLRE